MLRRILRPTRLFARSLNVHSWCNRSKRTTTARTTGDTLVPILLLSIGMLAAAPAKANVMSEYQYFSHVGYWYVGGADWTFPGSQIWQFDPSLGTLQSVTFHDSAQVTEYGVVAEGKVLWGAAGEKLTIAGITASGGGSCFAPNVSNGIDPSTCNFAFTIDQTFTSSLSAFIGLNQLSPAVDLGGTGYSDVTWEIDPEPSSAYLTYNYVPAPVTAPSGISLLGSGLLGLYLFTGWQARCRRKAIEG